MSEDDFDRLLLCAGKRAVAPTSRMRGRALAAAAAAATAGTVTAATTKATASKATLLAKLVKGAMTAKWTILAVAATATVGTAIHVSEETSARDVEAPSIVEARAPRPAPAPPGRR